MYIRINEKVKSLLGDSFDKLTMTKRINLTKTLNNELGRDYEEAYERKVSLEHLLTRETPVLELAEHDSIFDYSTEYVKKGDPYLKENPIGNKDIVLKKYHPTPFISMPIAQ